MHGRKVVPQERVREEMSTPRALHLGEETDPCTPGGGGPWLDWEIIFTPTKPSLIPSLGNTELSRTLSRS